MKRMFLDGRTAVSLRLALWGIVALLYFFSPLLYPSAFGQQPTPRTSPVVKKTLSTYEGQTVVTIQLAGQPGLNPDRFAADFIQKAGEPFSSEKIQQTIQAIEHHGNFSNIQLVVDTESKGVRVLLVLQPAVYFGIFEFPGAERFSYSRLVQVTNYPPGAPFNNDDIQQDAASLVHFFQQEGYFQAQVDPRVELQKHQIANIFFNTTLNRQSKFGALVFTGANPQVESQLRGFLHGIRARIRGIAIRPGKAYHHATLTKATRAMEKSLEKKGFLAARVKLTGAEYIASENRANIHFDIQTGPIVHVKILGAHLWPWTRKSVLPIYQGVGVDSELVQEGRQSLIDFLQGKSYFDVKVDASFDKQPSVDQIVYKITKGKKHKVQSVAIVGNRHIHDSQLMPLVAVKKSSLFSRGKYNESLVKQSAKDMQAFYQSQGYGDAKVTSAVTEKDKKLSVLFHVTEGLQDTVESLTIVGARQLTQSQYAPKGLQLGQGKPYSQQLVAADRTNIMSHYLALGFLNANFRETASVASKKSAHQVQVTYHIHEGPQVYTNNVLTLGRKKTRQHLINNDLASIKKGQPLTETQLLSSGSQLYNNPGVFDWAEVDPKRQITTQTKEDVLVKVHEAKKNEIHYGLGFEIINRGGSIPSGTVALPNLPPVGLPSNYTTSQTTYYGPRGTFEYTRNNVGGKGESLSLTAFAGRLDQRGAIYYIDPNFFWSRWTSTASISVDHNGENPVFSSQEEIASYQVQRTLNKANTDTLFFRYSFSQTDLTRIEIPQLVLPQDQHVRLSTPAVSLTHDTRDNILDAHHGQLQSVELDFTSSKIGASVDFAKLTAQFAVFKPIPHGIVWANSIRVGLAEPYAGSRVPISEAFFTGGASSLRGFPLDGAGPQRQVQVCSSGSSTNCSFIQVPSGGNELLILNTELRIPFPPPIKKGLGMAIFYDGGSVFPRVGFHDFTSLYSNNIGAGLRYATPVGPFRVDLGRNLNPVPGIQATQYFISIGQAF